MFSSSLKILYYEVDVFETNEGSYVTGKTFVVPPLLRCCCQQLNSTLSDNIGACAQTRHLLWSKINTCQYESLQRYSYMLTASMIVAAAPHFILGVC